MDRGILFLLSALIACASAQTDVDHMIKNAYCTLFGHCPDAAGLQHCKQVYHATEGDMREVVRVLVKSHEFRTKHIGSNPKEYPDILYKKLFGHEADSDGRNYWTKEIETEEKKNPGFGWHRCVDGLINSTEFKKKMKEHMTSGSKECHC